VVNTVAYKTSPHFAELKFLTTCHCLFVADAVEVKTGKTEDQSMSTDASLNRSYDTAISGRRTRSARSSARRLRVRAADSTSSMPTSTTDDGEQKTAAQDNSVGQSIYYHTPTVYRRL